MTDDCPVRAARALTKMIFLAAEHFYKRPFPAFRLSLGASLRRAMSLVSIRELDKKKKTRIIKFAYPCSHKISR